MTDNATLKMQFLFSLRKAGIVDKKVLDAMERVDRKNFVTSVFSEKAYDDTPLPIACGQTISQPTVVGLMTQALQVTSRDKVLEVGTGSGYQAAILGLLARRVYTVERHSLLVNNASKVFQKLNISNITTICADGGYGLEQQAPFDRIIVTAASDDPPAPLLSQLKTGGIMVIPVGQSDNIQNLIKIAKTDGGYDYQDLQTVRFVPLVAGTEKEQ
ncbi:protein-L-isoaspartate(D-aspartate) O-methyltransferase [Paracoccaceae bacterium]|nr:protein-L-isoaspartate(D-aspartate) O-methyltransferase [Paracoccaceae bacterium]